MNQTLIVGFPTPEASWISRAASSDASSFEREMAAASYASAHVRALTVELQELALRVSAGGKNRVARPSQQRSDFRRDRAPLFGRKSRFPGRFHFPPVHVEELVEKAVVAGGNRRAKALSRWRCCLRHFGYPRREY